MKPASSPILAIGLVSLFAIFWSRVPEVHQYDLQFLAFGFLMYLGVRLRRTKRLHDLLPKHSVFDFSFLALILFLLVFHSGGLNSPASVLLIVLAFLGVSILPFGALATYAVAVPVVLSAFPSTILSSSSVTQLLIFALAGMISLIVKLQHEHLHQARALNTLEELHRSRTLIFFHTTLLPKLEVLTQLAEYPSENQAGIQGQIQIIREETIEIVTDLQEI